MLLAGVLLSLFFLTPCFAYTQIANTTTELQIRNKLALYSYAVDNKKVDDLEQVFTDDVYANYGIGEGSILEGVRAGFSRFFSDLIDIGDHAISKGGPALEESVKNYITTAVTGRVTQHVVSSILVESLPASSSQNRTVTSITDPKNGATGINSTTYLVASTFGQGDLAGKVVTYV
ncbi:MAG: hypothetical protein Q9169_007214 [Polycauliona sp. 2 TL-2023]